MAFNEKQVTLEPTQFDRKNAIAAIYTFLAIATWCLGTVLTVFSALAYAGVGSFNEMFGEAFANEFTLEVVILIGVGVLVTGFVFLTIAEVFRLLQKNASTVYLVRGLDSVAGNQLDPETLRALLEAAGNPGAGIVGEPGESVVYDRMGSAGEGGMTVPMGNGAMQITVNVNTPSGQPTAEAPRITTTAAPAAASAASPAASTAADDTVSSSSAPDVSTPDAEA